MSSNHVTAETTSCSLYDPQRPSPPVSELASFEPIPSALWPEPSLSLNQLLRHNPPTLTSLVWDDTNVTAATERVPLFQFPATSSPLVDHHLLNGGDRMALTRALLDAALIVTAEVESIATAEQGSFYRGDSNDTFREGAKQ